MTDINKGEAAQGDTGQDGPKSKPRTTRRATPSNKTLSPMYMLVAATFPVSVPIVYTEISQALEARGFAVKSDIVSNSGVLRQVSQAINSALSGIAHRISKSDIETVLGVGSDDPYVLRYHLEIAKIKRDQSEKALETFALSNTVIALRRALGGDAYNILTQASK